jgi:hypothetical protein
MEKRTLGIGTAILLGLVAVVSASVYLWPILKNRIHPADARHVPPALAKPAAGPSPSSPADKPPDRTEQMSFSVEEGFEKPVSLPNEVLQLLKKDTITLEASVGCTERGGGPDVLQASWFKASEIHLGTPGEIDLLVMAANGCLNGANVGPFWVARKTSQGYRLVLSTGGHSLEVMGTRSEGFRDIQTYTASAITVSTVVYRFNGEKYEEFDSSSEPIGAETEEETGPKK